MMKVLSKKNKEPGIWMDEAEIPKIGANDVLIKIKKTAICGTDLHIYNWDAWSQKTIPVPMHVGHEYIGKIVEIGNEVKNLTIGQRVSGEGHIVCGHCRNCRAGKKHLCRNTIGIGVNRPGCFAQYLSIPASNAFKIPDNISDDVASILDPLGNAVHTALSFDLVGEDVLITGAGPIGLLCIVIARHVGARHIVITDINDYRLNIAKNLNVTRAINVIDCSTAKETEEKIHKTMSDLKMTEGFDIGLEVSGVPMAITAMINSLNNGAKMAMLGISSRDEISIDYNKMVWNGLFLKGIYGREMYETWYKMIALLQSGMDVSPVITHHFDVDDYIKAFEIMKSGQCGKVILNWE